MKRQSAVGLFFSMFLRAAVIILGIVIVVFGAMFITKVVKGSSSKSSSEPATTVSDIVLNDPEVKDDLLTADTTETVNEDVEETEVEAAFDKNILVLNSTDVSGLAGRWCDSLNGYGYANTTASDYSEQLDSTRIISTTDGVGQELIDYFNGASYEVGTVDSGISVDTSGYDIVIIIGTADSDQ